jgi:hypothetical protein
MQTARHQHPVDQNSVDWLRQRSERLPSDIKLELVFQAPFAAGMISNRAEFPVGLGRERG